MVSVSLEARTTAFKYVLKIFDVYARMFCSIIYITEEVEII
jgi:hypothetical protein